MSNIVFSQTPVSYNLFLYPTGDNAVALQIFPTSPVTHFDKVDEAVTSPNDDTDYVFCNTIPPAILDMYALTDHTTEIGTINFIQVFTRAKAYPVAQSPSGEYKHKITCGAGNALSPNYAPLSTVYNEFSTIWTTSPATSVAWTWAEIDALLAGISVSSPTVTSTIDTIFRPNAAGTANENRHCINEDIYAGDATNYQYVDEDVADDLGTYLYNTMSLENRDSYNIPNSSGLSGTINYVALFARMRKAYSSQASNAHLSLRCSSAYYDSASILLTMDWTTYFNTWTTDPSGGSWSWAKIDALEIGLTLGSAGHNYYSQCTQLYLVVNSLETAPPQIRTTQQYVMVNYSPTTGTVTLLAPNSVRLNNSRKTERFIFPDGTYTIADYGRAGKKLSLTGTETTNAIQKMRQVRAMLDSPSPISISGLLDVNQDIQWRLTDFDYEYDIGGDHYLWTADLTSYDYVEGSP